MIGMTRYRKSRFQISARARARFNYALSLATRRPNRSPIRKNEGEIEMIKSPGAFREREREASLSTKQLPGRPRPERLQTCENKITPNFRSNCLELGGGGARESRKSRGTGDSGPSRSILSSILGKATEARRCQCGLASSCLLSAAHQ